MSIAAAVADAKPRDRRWSILAIVVAAQFMFVVDAFVVTVAIPSIRADLHASIGEIQSVIVLYQIAFASLIIIGGRLGDMRGPKRLFLLGLAGFTMASLWCGLAGSGVALIVARACQGAAAALMIPQVLATIHRLFPDAERGRAFGIYGFTLGFGAAVGLGLGGWLVALDIASLGWRMIFLINVPIGLALLAAAARSMPVATGHRQMRLDLIGAAMLFTALLCLIAPLLLGNDFGWRPWLFAVLAAGASLLALIWPVERWVGRRGKTLPLVPLDLVKERAFATGLAAVLCFTFANFSFYLTMMLYMQLGLGFSPLQSGTTMIPVALCFAVASRIAGARAQRLGVTAPVQGCGVQIAGLAILGGGIALGGPVTTLRLALLLLVFGIGQALVMAPLYGLVLGKVPGLHAGSAGGIVSTVQQIGNGSGVAAIGAIYYALQACCSPAEAILASLAVLAVALLMTACLLLTLRRERTRSGAATSPRAPAAAP